MVTESREVRSLLASLDNRCAMLGGKVRMTQADLDEIRAFLKEYEDLLREQEKTK